MDSVERGGNAAVAGAGSSEKSDARRRNVAVCGQCGEDNAAVVGEVSNG